MIARILLFLAFALPLAASPAESVLSAPWREHLATLAAPRTLAAAFTEHRHTPLKKKPVTVAGTVRIDRARGLSLAYDQPRAPVVILDSRGLRLRHPDGREQLAPPEAESDLRLLHALFAFDLPTLEKSYALATAGDPATAWTLTFTRLPDSPATYRELILAGTADRLTAVTLAKSPNLRTEITLAEQVLEPTFSAEDLARYF